MKDPEKFKKKLEVFLSQKDLTSYDLCLFSARGKDIYEAIFPEATKGYYMKKARKVGQKRLQKNKSKEPNKIKSFAKFAADIRHISERAIRTKIRDGRIIEKILLFKKGILTQTEVFRTVKADIQLEPIERKDKIINKDKFCKQCRLIRASTCPSCFSQVLICLNDLDRGILILKKHDSNACDKFEN